jgi:hypothetical protein
MAVIAINIHPELYREVTSRLGERGYLDLDQFFDVAVRNQLALESSANERTRAPEASGDGQDGPSDEKLLGSRPLVAAGNQHPERQGGGSTKLRRDWESLAARAQLTIEEFSPAQVDDNANHILWGQVNRLLPVATGIRVLANLLGDEEGIALAKWHKIAADVALALRDELRLWDKRANRAHGTRWATAFPERNPASTQRYLNQFLGVPGREGHSEGGAAFLGLVEISGSGEAARASLTRGGAIWASMANPIFDANGAEPTSTFSEDEVRFFLEHLHEYRIGEYRFVNTVADFVARGLSREQQQEAIAVAYPHLKAVASTMRAGAIGRLGDLGLLERTRRGLNVDYRLTSLAGALGLPDAEEVVGS